MTGIRALAATWVLVGHCRVVLVDLAPGMRVFDPWFGVGFLGVDVFFLLSGFIISYNYAQRMPELDRRRYGAFLFARFARIYPVHLVMLVASAVMMAVVAVRGTSQSTPDHSVGGLIGNVLLLQALPGFEVWNDPSWSISCEAAAYVLFPLGAALLLRLTRRGALALALVVVVAQLGVTMLLVSPRSSTPPMSWVRIAGEFTLGCLLWAAWRHGERTHWRWDVTALVAAGLTALYLGVTPRGPLSYLVVPLLAVFVVATASTSGPVRAVLASRLMEWGGRVSYSLYLTHFLVLSLLIDLVPPAGLAGAPLALRIMALVSYVLVCVAVAVVTYYVVEEPARAWLRRRAEGWQSIGFGERRSGPAEKQRGVGSILEPDGRSSDRGRQLSGHRQLTSGRGGTGHVRVLTLATAACGVILARREPPRRRQRPRRGRRRGGGAARRRA